MGRVPHLILRYFDRGLLPQVNLTSINGYMGIISEWANESFKVVVHCLLRAPYDASA